MGSLVKIVLIIASITTILSGYCLAGIRTDFNYNNQTYNWSTMYGQLVNRKNFYFQTSFVGVSNLIKINGNRWQENATAGLDSRISLSERFKIIAGGEYTVNGLDKRRVRSSNLDLGLSYSPVKYIEIQPVVKVVNKRRVDTGSKRVDQGIGYSIKGLLNPFSGSGFDISSSISYDKTNLTNIPSQEGIGIFSAKKAFGASDSLQLSLRGLESTKKYYNMVGDQTNITKQIKREREAAVAVIKALPLDLKLTFDGNAHLSSYLYRSDIGELVSQSQRDNYGMGGGYRGGLSWNIDGTAETIIGYAWNRSKQDYQGTKLDLNTEVGELSFSGKLTLSSKDSVSADMFFGVTSYSNPNSEANNFDRDQKSIVVNGRFNHVFSKYFNAGLTGGGNSFHQIYVSGAESANNNRNDTYSLTPYFLWRPYDKFFLNQSFDIQANYITFDFDRKTIGTRNRIFRRATTTTEMTVLISDNLTWVQSYAYRYEDYGQLIWSDGWQQAVGWDRRRHSIDTKFDYSPNKIFRIIPYFEWEKTGDYDHTAVIKPDIKTPIEIRNLSEQQVKQIFEIKLLFKWHENSSLSADFIHRIRTFKNRPHEITDYVTLSMEYLF